MPVFQGVRMQRGHGLGSVLKGFFRSAWPLIETGAKAFGRQFFKTGMQIANDVAEGHPLKDASLKHVPEGIKAFDKKDKEEEEEEEWIWLSFTHSLANVQ